MTKYTFRSEDMHISNIEYYYKVYVYRDGERFAWADVDIEIEQKREEVYLGYFKLSDKLSKTLESELKSQILNYCYDKIEAESN